MYVYMYIFDFKNEGDNYIKLNQTFNKNEGDNYIKLNQTFKKY